MPVRTAPYLTAFSVVPLASFAFVGSITIVYAVIFMVLVAMIAFNAGMPAIYQGIAPGSVRARLTAGAIAIATLSGALGPIVVGYLSNRMAHNDNALLIACTEIGVPLTLLSAAPVCWAGRPLQATLKAAHVQDESISRSL